MRLKVAKEMAERLDEFTDAAEEISKWVWALVLVR
jgi:hypothetical protein